MKQMLLDELYKKYDKINSKLQAPFLKMHYSQYEILDMKLELTYIEILIDQLKKED